MPDALRIDQGIPINPPPGTATGDFVIPMVYFSQADFRNLCWAVCAQMILGYEQKDATLSEIVTRVVGPACVDLRACDVAVWPNVAYPSCGITFQAVQSSIDQLSIQNWIKNLYPIQIYFQWSGGSGHTALIAGIFSNGDLWVLDPKYGVGRKSYPYVMQAYGLGAWNMTWFNMGLANNGAVV